MKIIEDYIDNIHFEESLSIALGTFDGVHRGHQELIKRSVAIAREKNLKSAVLTFDTHPIKVLKPDAHVKIITNNIMKAEIIEKLGVDYLIFIKFNREFANIEEKKFIELLVNNLKCNSIACGFNYTYGKNGHGNISTLKSHIKEYNYSLSVTDKVTLNGNDISSSLIRHKLEHGDITTTNDLLGYKYYIKGNIVLGKQLGRKLGFPTANIEISDHLCLRNGVYISRTHLDGKIYESISSTGKNPTVGDTKRMFETHIFNFSEDIYDKELKVELLGFVRNENRFNSVNELQDRVFKDIEITKKYFIEHDIYKMEMF